MPKWRPQGASRRTATPFPPPQDTKLRGKILKLTRTGGGREHSRWVASLFLFLIGFVSEFGNNFAVCPTAASNLVKYRYYSSALPLHQFCLVLVLPPESLLTCPFVPDNVLSAGTILLVKLDLFRLFRQSP